MLPTSSRNVSNGATCLNEFNVSHLIRVWLFIGTFCSTCALFVFPLLLWPVTLSLVYLSPGAAFFSSFVILRCVRLVSALCCVFPPVLRSDSDCLQTSCRSSAVFWQRAAVHFETWGNWKQQPWLTAVNVRENICTWCSTLWKHDEHITRNYTWQLSPTPVTRKVLILRNKTNKHDDRSEIIFDWKSEKQTNMGRLSHVFYCSFCLWFFWVSTCAEAQTSDEQHCSSYRIYIKEVKVESFKSFGKYLDIWRTNIRSRWFRRWVSSLCVFLRPAAAQQKAVQADFNVT